MINVILLERVGRLGGLGSIVKVRPGFARNFLLPRRKALRATEANKKAFEHQREELEARNAALKAEAEANVAPLTKVTLVLIRQAGDTGQLYGSVTARDLAEAAKAAGHAIERGQIQIPAPIKTIGLFAVTVRLHPEVVATITLNVARSPEEAIVQAEKGVAATKAAAVAALPTDTAETALPEDISAFLDVSPAEETAEPAKA